MAARVAVVGASGIGKHHAKWWALEGADVAGLEIQDINVRFRFSLPLPDHMGGVIQLDAHQLRLGLSPQLESNRSAEKQGNKKRGASKHSKLQRECR